MGEFFGDHFREFFLVGNPDRVPGSCRFMKGPVAGRVHLIEPVGQCLPLQSDSVNVVSQQQQIFKSKNDLQHTSSMLLPWAKSDVQLMPVFSFAPRAAADHQDRLQLHSAWRTASTTTATKTRESPMLGRVPKCPSLPQLKPLDHDALETFQE